MYIGKLLKKYWVMNMNKIVSLVMTYMKNVVMKFTTFYPNFKIHNIIKGPLGR